LYRIMAIIASVLINILAQIVNLLDFPLKIHVQQITV
jgi:hypothetical protein